MIRFVQVGLAELMKRYREIQGDFNRSEDYVLEACFESGIRLWVLVLRNTAECLRVPEFHLIWWRNAYSWAKQFEPIESIVRELRQVGRRSEHPFLASAPSRMSRWERVWSGCRVDLEGYVEFILPDDVIAITEARRFLGRWADTIGFEGSRGLVLEANSDQQDLVALMGMPTGGADSLDAQLTDRVEERLNELVHRCPEAQPHACNFPNILQILLPPNLSATLAKRWQRILDLRVTWLARVASPDHYPLIKGLASVDQWGRQFVFEAEEQRCRGRALVGPERMATLLEIGLELEKRFPVLAAEACPPPQA